MVQGDTQQLTPLGLLPRRGSEHFGRTRLGFPGAQSPRCLAMHWTTSVLLCGLGQGTWPLWALIH